MAERRIMENELFEIKRPDAPYSDIFVTQGILCVILGIALATVKLFFPQIAEDIISAAVGYTQDTQRYVQYLIDVIGASL